MKKITAKPRQTCLSRGIPKMLVLDKGSANTSAAFRRSLDVLGVIRDYPPANPVQSALAKGRVEAIHDQVKRNLAHCTPL